METEAFIQENNFEKARKKIKQNQGGKIIFSSDKDELNRKVIENEYIDVLLLSQKTRKDRQRQRDSGFNHILAKIAKKNNVAIGINFDEILETKGKEKAEILARVKQNIKLCNKNNLKMRFICLKKENQRDAYDLKALGLVLGMPTWMIQRDLT